MRHLPIVLTALLGPALAAPATAQPQQAHKPATASHSAPPGTGPTSIGKFEDWTAATHQEAGQAVCYAFTRAQSSNPSLPSRGPVILTVTERPSGRDAVAIEAGFAYAAHAAVTVQVDQAALDFYTDVSQPRNAFARDGKAVVGAFQKGSRAIARSPGPKDVQVTDTFSLKGFSAAYGAIVKACPAK